MTKPTPEEKVDELINELLESEHLANAFAGFLAQAQPDSKSRKENCLTITKKFWQALPQANHEAALQHYVKCVLSQANSTRCQLLLDMLEGMVETNILNPRGVCETTLNSVHLHQENADKWCRAFKLIRAIIGGVDYKGCRDLLRIMMEKTLTVPASCDFATMKIVDAVYDVVSYVLDRNTCLLPSYFAVNEITKLCTDDRPHPHWKLGKLLTDFVQSFRATAQIVSVSGRSSLLPVVGHSSGAANVWKLNTSSLRFNLNGPLPYSKELSEPQTALLRYVLEQPYSRDMVCTMLSLNKQAKQRCSVLEDLLVDLVVMAMERSEGCDDNDEEVDNTIQLLWQHLSSQLIFFVLFQFASFPHMVMALYEKLKGRSLRKGRDHLMWILLQFISGSIQKNPLEDFLPVMKLYDLLYPEKDALLLPDVSKASAAYKMAVTCIWIHLNKKAQNEKVQLQRPIPHALQSHIEYLKQCSSDRNLPMNDYRIALLCNAYSTNNDYFTVPLSILVDSIYGNNQKTTMLPGNITASSPTAPLRMCMLDSLTVHAKMSLIHNIVTKVIRLAQTKSAVALAPALVETYSRLLVYIEIESLGIKGFISQLLPNVFKSHAWGILHTLLEMFSYRLHHIQPHYRVQLLSHLHSLASVPQTNQNQLHLCVESTALRLIMGLGSWEVQPQLSRVVSEPKTLTLLSSESEELNRALVLTLARAMHVTGSESLSGSWCKEILSTIMQHTPHNWSSHTLACFPQSLSDFFQQNSIPRDDSTTLKRNIETEYRMWKSMASENDLISYFSKQGSPPLFLCVLFKSLLEDKRIAPTAYKILDRLGPRLLASHLRTFADYLVYEFASASTGPIVNKRIESLNDFMWKCNIVPFDRLILCLALRNFDGSEAKVLVFIIRVLLVQNQEFQNRVTQFVKENSPEHWLQNNWHEKHMAFHRDFPEQYYYDGGQDMSAQSQYGYLPVYFGNVCLRFLPVLDIVIHRILEVDVPVKSWEPLLDQLGGLYKFHDRPMTYLYNTLHYYEKRLKDKPLLKRYLVNTIIGSLKDIKPANWCLSADCLEYMEKTEETSWVPEQDYYTRLIHRLVTTIVGDQKNPFPTVDWRFNEFPNPAAHALHATCIELMVLPVSSQSVGNALLDIVLKGTAQIPRDLVMSWMNAIGMVLTALPDGYWLVINDRVLETLKSPCLTSSDFGNPFHMLNFTGSHRVSGELPCSYVLALCHAVWQHASIGQLSSLPSFLKEKVRGVVETEQQLLFICHLVGPFLQRFHSERTRCLLELTVELYELLEIVDRSVEHLYHVNPISDFLYHIKYMWVGDGVKNEVEKIIRNLRPALRLRLRYISHHTKEDGTSA